MAQNIEFEYEGKQYTLEFTRDIVRQMENAGFLIDEVQTKPALRVPQLFAGAFLRRHRREKQEKIEEIYKHFKDKDRLIAKLSEMYYEALSTIMDEPEEDDPKKIVW